MRQKAQQEARGRLREEHEAEAMRAKFAEDERRERARQAARREATAAYSHAVRAQLEEQERRKQAAQEAERRAMEEAETREAHRRRVVTEARRRLLEEHGAALAGFLPKVRVRWDGDAHEPVREMDLTIFCCFLPHHLLGQGIAKTEEEAALLRERLSRHGSGEEGGRHDA